MAEVKTGGDVRPGEFQLVLRSKEYTSAGIDPVKSEDLSQPYVLGLVEVSYKDDGSIVIHGHPYVGGLYSNQLAEVIGRNVYKRVCELATPTLKTYVHLGHNAKIDLTIREIRHVLREIGLMEPAS